MAGQHAEIAFHAGNVDLIDFAGEGEFFGRDEIEVEGGHGAVLCELSPAGLTRESSEGRRIVLAMDCRVTPAIDYSPSYAASAASFLPFSTASSMVPTM